MATVRKAHLPLLPPPSVSRTVLKPPPSPIPAAFPVPPAAFPVPPPPFPIPLLIWCLLYIIQLTLSLKDLIHLDGNQILQGRMTVNLGLFKMWPLKVLHFSIRKFFLHLCLTLLNLVPQEQVLIFVLIIVPMINKMNGILLCTGILKVLNVDPIRVWYT